MFKKNLSFLILSLMFVNSIKSQENMLVYTGLDFYTKIGSHKIAIVDFYAPWCRYSQGLAPEFDKAAIILKDILKLEDVSLIKVDCYEANSAQLCTDQKIFGYPTLKVYKNGIFFKDYSFERTADSIVYFMLDIVNGFIV